MHKKSPCCQEKIWCFGKKRRQCSLCKQTWSVWPRKRGRPRRRNTFTSLLRYLGLCDYSVRQRSLQNNQSVRTMQARMAALAERYASHTSWPTIPSGDLIAVADAMWLYSNGSFWTVYFILLRSIDDDKAVVTKPLLIKGRETQHGGWDKAFSLLSLAVHKRIVALVCDGAPSLVSHARNYGWALQRCHFHLLAELQHCASIGPRSNHRREARMVHFHIRRVLKSTDMTRVMRSYCVIKKIFCTTRLVNLRTVLSGFLRNYQDYRSYICEPGLNLPNTSNSAESFIGMIRRLQRKAHGFSSVTSLSIWIEAFCKHRQTILCKRSDHQQN